MKYTTIINQTVNLFLWTSNKQLAVFVCNMSFATLKISSATPSSRIFLQSSITRTFAEELKRENKNLDLGTVNITS